MRIVDLAEPDRPRERLLAGGACVLSDRELLALVLGSGTTGTDAVELAALLIADAGDLAGLATVPAVVLRRRPGMGAAKAARVEAAFELGRRAEHPPARRRIRGSADLAAVAAPLLRGLCRERVVVVVCDLGGRVRHTIALTEGAADRSLLPVRDVLSTVLAAGGTAFGVAHNHPSGLLGPSEPDRQATERLREAADTVGLLFLDHVIIAGDGWRRVP